MLRVKDLTLDNHGCKISALTDKEMADARVPEYLKIRGYRINTKKPLVLEINEPGNYELGADGKLRRLL